MTHKRLSRFLKRYVLDRLPGWSIGQSALVRRHDDALLLLIDFNSSGFDKDSFDVSAVVFPLYLDYDYLILTIGVKLQRHVPSTWRIRDEYPEDAPQIANELVDAIKAVGWPFLRRLCTLKRFVNDLPQCFPREHEFRIESLAGAEVLCGNVAEAERQIAKVLHLWKSYKVEWADAKVAEWSRFLELLHRDPRAARQELIDRILTCAQQLKAPPVTPVPPE